MTVAQRLFILLVQRKRCFRTHVLLFGSPEWKIARLEFIFLFNRFFILLTQIPKQRNSKSQKRQNNISCLLIAKTKSVFCRVYLKLVIQCLPQNKTKTRKQYRSRNILQSSLAPYIIKPLRKLHLLLAAFF